MNHLQRATYLFKEAERDGLDFPTEQQVADAINDACGDTKTEIVLMLRSKGMGAAADYLERIEDRRHLKDEDA